MFQEHSPCLHPLKFEKTTYESSPIASNTIENNRVQLLNYRGVRITSFNVNGRQLICLPQAFDYFLKYLVGGLHTVYTKLKRLDIIPIVCNVEQVRILRSLGAIQPGVNRCKLLAPNEFDILYNDCTHFGSRPGRPLKRQKFPTDSSHSLQSMSSNQSMMNMESFSFFYIKNIIETSHLHENHLNNEIADLKNEITKEHDYTQKLQQKYDQLQRIRNILIKKIKRLNRS